MSKVLVFYGSYRRGRVGIRLAERIVSACLEAGAEAELIDAKAVNLPMLDLRYSDYAAGEAPRAMAELSAKITGADACIFVAGEYNGGPQPGLKNLVDHYFAEWSGKLGGVVTYSSGRLAGVKSGYAWGAILDKLGMMQVPGAPEVGSLQKALAEDGRPVGDDGARLEKQIHQYSAKVLKLAEKLKSGS